MAHALMLGRHQLHPPVQRAAGIVGVGAYRRKETNARSFQLRLRNAKILHQFSRHRLRAPPRQIEIVVVGALIVGVADDEDIKLRLAGQQLGDLFERRAAFGFHHRLVGIEIDAIERDVAGFAEAF